MYILQIKTMTKETLTVFPDEVILNKIYLIRGKKVMPDRDLAEMYDVETKRLKEAVKRNIDRFPKDFMFEMNKREFKNWRSQFATSNSDNMGLRYAPCCFTEQGVTMLACILNSKRSIDVNIRIIRVFTRMREMIMANKDILLKLELLEKQVTQNNDDIQLIFSALKEMLTQPEPERKKIGYRLPEKN